MIDHERVGILAGAINSFREQIFPEVERDHPDLFADDSVTSIFRRSVEADIASATFGMAIFAPDTDLPHQVEAAESAELALGYKPESSINFRNSDQLRGLRAAGVSITGRQGGTLYELQHAITTDLVKAIREREQELNAVEELGAAAYRRRKGKPPKDLSTHQRLAPPRDADTLGRVLGHQPWFDDDGAGRHPADED